MPITVRAPDGTLVNFPDGMSDSEITRVMRQNYPPPRAAATKPKPKKKEEGFFSSIGSAFQRGIPTIQEGISTIIEDAPRIIGETLAATSLANPVAQLQFRGLGQTVAKSPAYKEAVKAPVESIRRSAALERARLGPGTYGSVFEEKGFGRKLASLSETVAESSIPVVAGLGVGALTRSPVAAGLVMGAGNVPMTYGGIRETQKTEGIDDVSRALAGTAASSALDLLTGAGGKVLNAAAVAARKEILERGLKAAAVRVLQTGRNEAGTEMLQTVIEQVAGGSDPVTKQAMLDTLESGLAGGLGGTVVGTAGELVSAPFLAKDRAAPAEQAEAPPPPPSAPRAPPPPADMGALAKALGPVGGKITLQEPAGPQEYVFQGFDEDGGVVLADADGVVFSEDPDQVQAAIKSGVVEPESGLGGIAFGMDITEGLPEVAAPPPPPPVAASNAERARAIVPVIEQAFDAFAIDFEDAYGVTKLSGQQLDKAARMVIQNPGTEPYEAIDNVLKNEAGLRGEIPPSVAAPPPPPPPVAGIQAQADEKRAAAPGEDAGNGFFFSGQGGVSRVATDLFLRGAVMLERRYEGGTAGAFYVGKDGNLIDADNVNFADSRTKEKIWTGGTEGQRNQVAELLRQAQLIDLKDPVRKPIMAQIKQIVTGAQEQLATDATAPPPATDTEPAPKAKFTFDPTLTAAPAASRPTPTPQQIVDNLDSFAVTEAQDRGLDVSMFREGARDVRRGFEPLIERQILFMQGPEALAAYKAGMQWAQERIAEAQAEMPQMTSEDATALQEEQDFLDRLEGDLGYIAEQRAENAYERDDPEAAEAYALEIADLEAAREDALRNIEAIKARYATPATPATPAAAAPAAPPPPAAPRAVGKSARATIPATREKVDVQYELQDLDNIRFAEGELQNRDRSRPQTQQFLRRFTSEFDPEGLGEDKSTDRGAPIINKDNIILSGNGRTLGLEEIYDKYPEQAEAYREFLREEGYDVEGIERPILVRRLMSDVDERKFVVASNEADVAALSPPEQAKQDAKDILTPGLLSKYKGGDLDAAKNDAFVSAFIAEMSPQQRENAMDDKGNVSAQALKRIENALLYKAYGGYNAADSEAFMSKAMERSDDDTKTLTNALIDAANDWIKFTEAVESGEIDKKYLITGKLMRAVATVSDIKASGNSVSGALRSQDMFEEMDPFVKDILVAFYNDNLTRMLSKKAIAEKLSSYADIAANQQAEPDMFGKAETPSARDVWKRADEGAGQADMFARAEKPSQAAAKRIRSGIAAVAALTTPPASAAVSDTPIAPNSALYKSLESGDTKQAIALIQKNSKDKDARRIAAILAKNGVGEQKTVILDPVKDYNKAVTTLSENGANPETINLVASGEVRGVVFSTPRDKGIYLIKNKDRSSNGVNEETFLHETIHAYVKARWSSIGVYTERNRAALEERGLYNKEVAAEVQKFNDMWRKFSDIVTKEYDSGAEVSTTVISAAESPNEALAYILTNKGVQDYTKRIVKDGDGYRLMSEKEAGKRSWWDDFVDMIRKIFGLGPARDQFFIDFLEAGDRILVAGEKAEADFRVAAVNEEAVSPRQVRNNRQAMQVLLNGTPEQMRNAVAKAQKPTDKVIKEGADLQKKNRGCD